jgi:hypothetical protein
VNSSTLLGGAISILTGQAGPLAPAFQFSFVVYMSQHLNSNISAGQQVLYCGMIAISAVLILAPAVRLLPYAKLVVFTMMVIFLFTIVRREMRSRNLKLTLSQIYSQAKVTAQVSCPDATQQLAQR